VDAAAEFEAVSRRVPRKSRIRRVIVGINTEQGAIMLACRQEVVGMSCEVGHQDQR